MSTYRDLTEAEDWNQFLLDEIELGNHVAQWLDMENQEQITAAHWLKLKGVA